MSMVSGTRISKTDALGSLMQMTKSKKKLKNRGRRLRKSMKNWRRGKRRKRKQKERRMERSNSKFRISLIIKNPSYSKRTSGRGIKTKVACRPEFEAICCPNWRCQKDWSFWCQLAVNTNNLVGVDFVGP